MKTIKLSRGQIAIVDDEDYEALNSVKWCARWDPTTRGYYAVRNVPIGGGKRRTIRMHRAITGAAKGSQVDHINHTTLDNRRENLRLCTNSENQRNRGKQENNTSGFKGVSWDKATGKWRAQIALRGKVKYLGLFVNVLEAARAYDRACTEMHGEFARHNDTVVAPSQPGPVAQQ